MSRSRIYRTPRQNHLVVIQDLQEPTTEQKLRIHDLQDLAAKAKNENPGSPGSHDKITMKDPRSAASKIPRMSAYKKL